MRIFITSINNIELSRVDELDFKRRQKCERLKMTSDKKRCIAGGLFINRFFGDAVIYENEFGKPLADNGVHFNISHSGEYVMFVMAENPVGCDIEEMREVDTLKMGKFVFSESEMCEIENANNKKDKFFEFWTKKESLLKCMGEGFHKSAKSVNVINDFYEEEKIYYFKTWRISQYAISVCSVNNDFPESIEFIEI